MRRVTIYLGSRCNLDCKYCHRKSDKDEPKLSEQFLDELAAEGKDISIKFMGGEPTLYMDDIRHVVERCPEASFIVTTNGKLLQENMDYFREHRFFICISYDGLGTGVRGYDPFQDRIDYPWLGVSSTLYHGHTKLHEVMGDFAKKEECVGRYLSYYPHIMHTTDERNSALSLTRKDMDDIFEIIKECVIELVSDMENYEIVNRRYIGFLRHLLQRLRNPFLFGETYCVNRKLSKHDVSGQRFTCQYIRKDKLRDEDWKDKQQLLIKERFPSCECCEVYDMCGAACIMSKAHETECYYYRQLFSWFKGFYKEHEACLKEVKDYGL